MDKQQVLQAVKAIRAKVAKTGGWEGSWASGKGLKESQVGQWVCRGRIPRGWQVALRSLIEASRASE